MTLEASLRLTADVSHLAKLRHFVENTAARWRADAREMEDVVLAVDELVTNVMMHGYRGRPGPIEVTLRAADGDLMVRVRDQAPEFDPTQVPPPDLTSPLEERPIGGVGLHLVRNMVDELHYRPLRGGGNEVIVVKRGIVAG
jgi:serine/threonine-protein kinase RsbW